MPTMTYDAEGRFVRVPGELIVPAARGIIVRVTEQYTFTSTASGIVLPGQEADIGEKKYRLGEVVSLGAEVNREEVDVGDILVFLMQTAYRLPNGREKQVELYKVQHMDMSTMAVLPNLDPAKRSPRWSTPHVEVSYSGKAVGLTNLLDRLEPWKDRYLLTVDYPAKGAVKATISTGSMTRGDRARFAAYAHAAAELSDDDAESVTIKLTYPDLDAILKAEVEQWQSGREASKP